MCAYTKTFTLNHVRLDQTFCFYLCARSSKGLLRLCAPASKCLLSLYAPTSSLLFFCAPTFDVAFTHVRLYQKFAFFACIRQKVSFYSCAPTVHQNFAFFACAFIKTFPLTSMRMHQNVCFSPYAPTLKVCFFCVHFFVYCFYSRASISKVCFFCVRLHKNVSFYSCAPTPKRLP